MHSTPTRGRSFPMVDRRFLAYGEISGDGEDVYVLMVIMRVDQGY